MQEMAERSLQERQFPTVEELEENIEHGILTEDVSVISERINDVVRVLSNFSSIRDPSMTRKDYLALLTRDLATYYGYVPILIEKFMQLFPVEEVSVLSPCFSTTAWHRNMNNTHRNNRQQFFCVLHMPRRQQMMMSLRS